MRILLVNYRYFVSGGPERYMFNVTDALEALGHEVIPFSIRYAKNRPSRYEDYFVPPLAGPDAVTFEEHGWTPRNLVKTLERSFYSPEVERAVGRLIEDTKPDVAFILHYLRKLSPSVLTGIKKHGLPIVTMINDYMSLCPAIYCLREDKPCTLCCHGNLWPSVRYRCVQGSLCASLVALLSRLYHERRGYFDLIDRFIILNDFAMQMVTDAGWPEEKCVVNPLFARPDFFSPDPGMDKASPPYFLFSGSFAHHKGPQVLIRAYARAAGSARGEIPALKMIGNADTGFGAECRSLAEELNVADRMEFPGFADVAQLRDLYRKALFTVIPSTWYENLPNVLMESFASGTAVIASGHGSLSPYIDEGINGYTFTPGDPGSLAGKLVQAWSDVAWCREAGRRAAAKARDLFSRERHMRQLLDLFKELL